MSKTILHPKEEVRHVYFESGVMVAKPILGWLVLFAILLYPLAVYELVGEFSRLVILIALIFAAVIFRRIFLWRLNRNILTNRRLIKIAHTGLMKRLVIETPLERILNVSYKTTGILSSLFRYGDVEVQVVGLMEPMVLKNISHPSVVKDYLWKLHLSTAPQHHHLAGDAREKLQEEIGYTKHNQRIL